MRVHVKVTPEDIENGQRQNSSDCPVARAIGRELIGSMVYVSTLGCVIYPEPVMLDNEDRSSGPLRMEGRFGDKQTDWIFSFDEGQVVTPIEFDLELVGTA